MYLIKYKLPAAPIKQSEFEDYDRAFAFWRMWQENAEWISEIEWSEDKWILN